MGSLSTEAEVADAAYQTLPLLTGGASRLVRDTVMVTSKAVDERLDVGSVATSGNFWMNGLGAWSHQDEQDKSSGYTSSIYGIVAGVDGKLLPDLNMGVAFAYANSDAYAESIYVGDQAEVNSYQGILYGRYSLSGGATVRYQLDGGLHQTDASRRMAFGSGTSRLDETAKSDYNSSSVHGGLSIEEPVAVGVATNFIPRFGMDYVSVWSGSYSETGAGGLNLDVDSEQYQTLVFALSGRLEHTLSESFSLKVDAGLGYDALNDRSTVTAAYAGAPSLDFAVDGMQTTPWIVDGGIGLAFNPSDDIRVSADYNVTLRDGLDIQMAGLNARWSF